MLGHKNIKANALSDHIRIFRFYSILFSILAIFVVINYCFDIKMILLGYFFYPALLFCFIRLIYVKCKNSLALTELANDKSKLITKLSITELMNTFFKVFGLIAFAILSTVWLPALFMTMLLKGQDSYFAYDMLNASSDILRQITLIFPWPLLFFYIILFHIFSKYFNINNINDLCHSIYEGRRSNDTGHNFMQLVYSSPLILSVYLLFSVSVYILYYVLTTSTTLYPIIGVTEFSLGYCLFSALLIATKKVRAYIKSIYERDWSIIKNFSVTAGLLLLWMLLPTIIINVFFTNSQTILQGQYLYQSFEWKTHYIFFVWSIAWFIAPLLAHKVNTYLDKHSFLTKICLTILVILSIITFCKITYVKSILTSALSLFLSFNLVSSLLIPIYTIIVLYCHFKNKTDRTLFLLDRFASNGKESKTRSTGIIREAYILLSLPIILSLAIENVLLVNKMIAGFALVYLCLLVYFTQGLRKLISEVK